MHAFDKLIYDSETSEVPEIDWTNPDTKGLKFLSWSIGNGQVIDLVSGQIGINSGTITESVIESGYAVSSAGSSQISFPNVVHSIGQSALTLLVRFRWDGVVTLYPTALSLPNNSSIGIYLPRSGVLGSDSTSALTKVFNDIPVTSGKTETFGITSDASGGSLTGFGGGAKSNIIGVSGYDSSNVGVMLFNGQGSEYGIGTIEFAAVYNIALSDAAHARLAENWLSLLVPPKMPTQVFNAATAPTLSNPIAIHTSTTTADFSVDTDTVGEFYYAITTTQLLTAADILADAALKQLTIASASTISFSETGLTAGLTYYLNCFLRDSGSVDSNVINEQVISLGIPILRRRIIMRQH